MNGIPNPELFEDGSMFKVGELVSVAGECSYDDDVAWAEFLASVDELVRYNDAWGLLVQRPDGDTFLVDVLGYWQERVKALNGRSVRLVYPARRTAIDEIPEGE